MAPDRIATHPGNRKTAAPPATGPYLNWPTLPRRDTPRLRPRSTEWSHCGSFEDAKKYADQLMPGVHLDYIPKRDRDERNWTDKGEYLDPRWGRLRWCGGTPPISRGAIARTKMYVVGDIVGATVDGVIKATKKQEALLGKRPPRLELAWMEKEEVRLQVWAELERLKNIPPSHYWGRLDTLDADDMYELVSNKGATREDFLTWMDLVPKGQKGVDGLSDSMESLKLAEEKVRGYEAGDELSREWEQWEKMIKEELGEAMKEPGPSGVPRSPPTIPSNELPHEEID